MNAALRAADCLVADAWLTHTLARPVFSLRPPLPSSASSIRHVLRDAAGDARAFFFAKLGIGQTNELHALLEAGFRLIDVQLSFQWRDGEGQPSVPVRLANASDHGRVLRIAASAFEHSRFHRDPHIGREAANRLKERWAQNCLEGRRGTEVLVAGAGEAAGFLAVSVAGEGKATSAVIDLIAVARECQGRGVGRSLVHAFVARWRDRAGALAVGTQATNSASIRLYQACGFGFRDAAYIAHAHP